MERNRIITLRDFWIDIGIYFYDSYSSFRFCAIQVSKYREALEDAKSTAVPK